MTKAKAKRTEPGVYLRRDGRPRYEVKIRWTDASGAKRYLPTVIFPFDPSAKTGPTSEAIALASANRHALTERTALQLHDKPRAELAEAWTLGGLLTRLKDESQASIDALTSEGKAIPKYLQKNVSTARMLLGQSKPEDTANHRGFPDLCALPLTSLKPEHFSGTPTSMCARLLGRDGKPAPGDSVRRLVSFLGSMFGRAKAVWKIEFNNPLERWKDLALPPASKGRERILSPEEWKVVKRYLRQASPGRRGKQRTNVGTRLAVYTARFSAARREEVVKLNWEDLQLDDIQNATAFLHDTKSKNKNKPNHSPKNRSIPLPPHLARQLSWLKRRHAHQFGQATGPVFRGLDGQRIALESVSQAWKRACKRAGVENARLHDLRHTRITELGHRLNNPLQVAAISGHDDLTVLKRYFNSTASELGAILNKLEMKQKKAGSSDAVNSAIEALRGLSIQQMAEAMATAMQASTK